MDFWPGFSCRESRSWAVLGIEIMAAAAFFWPGFSCRESRSWAILGIEIMAAAAFQCYEEISLKNEKHGLLIYTHLKFMGTFEEITWVFDCV